MTDRLTGDEDFPLVRELIYLSTASVGLVPESVQADARRFDHDVSSRGTTWFDEIEELRILRPDEAVADQEVELHQCHVVGKFIGVAQPVDELADRHQHEAGDLAVGVPQDVAPVVDVLVRPVGAAELATKVADLAGGCLEGILEDLSAPAATALVAANLVATTAPVA